MTTSRGLASLTLRAAALLAVLLAAPAGAGEERPLKSVSVGSDHSCSLHHEDGVVECWGDNHFGQLNIPEFLPPGLSISAGGMHTCIVSREDGYVWCWGDNKFGQCDPPADLGPVVSMDAGLDHTCGIRELDRKVLCWGQQPNDPSRRDVVPEDLTPSMLVSAGGAGPVGHSCAVDESTFLVRCWGSNDYGQSAPPADLGPVESISCGGVHTCAVTRGDGVVRCWGFVSEGVVRVPGNPLQPGRPLVAASVSAGYLHTCAVKRDDQHLLCWGLYDDYISRVPDYLKPVSSVSGGGIGRNCAVRWNDDSVYCWGGKVNGEVSALGAPGQWRSSCDRGYTCGKIPT